MPTTPTSPTSPTSPTTIDDKVFEVPRATDMLGGLVARTAPLWRWLGGIETDILEDRLEKVRNDRPIYICGLARAGTTILLELIGSLPQIATHRYRDYPLIYTPYLWDMVLSRMPRRAAAPSERTHLDGIMVTPESPEAFEEVLWMHFFAGAHDPARSSLLDATTENPAFERFYPDHLRKLMVVQHASRYAAKGNYNIARLAVSRRAVPGRRARARGAHRLLDEAACAVLRGRAAQPAHAGTHAPGRTLRVRPRPAADQSRP
jgi:hypothetical protein